VAIARLSRQSPEAEGNVPAQAAPERLVVRNPFQTGESADPTIVTVGDGVTDRNPPKPALVLDCYGVTIRKGDMRLSGQVEGFL